MITNYFTVGVRNLSRQKAYSFIHIGGLSVGMAVAILIGLWIYDELTFNQSHQHYHHIALVMRHFTIDGKKETGGEASPIPLSYALGSSFGNEFTSVVISTKPLELNISSGNKVFTQSGRFMDRGAAEMLTLQMLEGSRQGLLDQRSVLLSASLAKKLFGDKQPLNKIIIIDTKLEAKVTGVYQDLPANSEFSGLSFIAPFDLYLSSNAWAREEATHWRGNSFPIYVQIAPHTSFEQVSAKIKDIMLPHLNQQRAALKLEVFLHPMSKWHLYSQFENAKTTMSEGLKFIYFYGTIGLFVLSLACINFMSLSTAGAEKRAKEVGIRKTIGSTRRQLIGQFLTESLLMATLAFVVCLCVVVLCLPSFNVLSGKNISILWTNSWFWIASIIFTLFTALLAGSYPAFYLSSFKPALIIKGAFRGSRARTFFGQALVIFQFSVSILLIIGI